jgi:hypothetical protein
MIQDGGRIECFKIFQEYWRGVTSTFTHYSFIHLVFNMGSLWGYGYMESGTDGMMGYIRYTFILIMISFMIQILFYKILIDKFEMTHYRTGRISLDDIKPISAVCWLFWSSIWLDDHCIHGRRSWSNWSLGIATILHAILIFDDYTNYSSSGFPVGSFEWNCGWICHSFWIISVVF